MNASDHKLMLVVADGALTPRLLDELVARRPAPGEPGRAPGHDQVALCSSLASARAQLARCCSAPAGSRPPDVILLDESVIQPGRCAEAAEGLPDRQGRAPHAGSFPEVVTEFSAFAPVVAALSPARLGELESLSGLIAAGRVECVVRAGAFLPLLCAVLERHTAAAPGLWPAPEEAAAREDFREILRHEVNNPLTGILGNAELLLARREQFSRAATQRIKTIAELAVRLRETIRRLSRALPPGAGSSLVSRT